ncbi:glycosyltransferase [Candidatus Micrarchaeota archaeon]|nr:glycosyltransferase [Candidatus Micrarchaeota archaeon]
MARPKISVVVPTKNSAKTLAACLKSIKSQTCKDYELIIVDGLSTDGTVDISRRYADGVISDGNGVSASRNAGFAISRGDVFVSIDSDMVVDKDLFEDITKNIKGHGALVLPEIGSGTSFISRCKDLEKRCYLGEDFSESARAFTKEAFNEVGGYDPTLRFGEDFDIHSRIKARHIIGRTRAMLHHDNDSFDFIANLRKAYRYGHSAPRYLAKGHEGTKKALLDLRHTFFIRHFTKLAREPVYGMGLSIIKIMEYCAGFAGFFACKLGF